MEKNIDYLFHFFCYLFCYPRFELCQYWSSQNIINSSLVRLIKCTLSHVMKKKEREIERVRQRESETEREWEREWEREREKVISRKWNTRLFGAMLTTKCTERGREYQNVNIVNYYLCIENVIAWMVAIESFFFLNKNVIIIMGRYYVLK